MDQPYRLKLKLAAGPVLVLSYHTTKQDCALALGAHVDLLKSFYEPDGWIVGTQDVTNGTSVSVYKQGQYKPLIKKQIFLMVETAPVPAQTEREDVLLNYQSWYKKIYGLLTKEKIVNAPVPEKE